jgi:peptide/nickel transport system substrate-binding protein
MSRNLKLVDAVRRRGSPVQSHLVDGLVDGRVDRREFLRHGSVLGLSLPLLGSVTATLGFGGLPRQARAAVGGTLRVGQQMPAAAVEPVSVADAGGLVLLQQVGEFLTWDGPDLVLRPQLAESWFPNREGTVWTFKLRRGVSFHDGRPMTAADVVATFDRLSDPANSSNALSVFRGLLSPGGTRKVDDHTVEFHLETANGGFPYTVS